MNIFKQVKAWAQQPSDARWSRELFDSIVDRIETGKATVEDVRWLAKPRPTLGYSQGFLACLGEIAVTGGSLELAARIRKFF